MKKKGVIILCIVSLLITGVFFGASPAIAATATASSGSASAIQSAINTVSSSGGGTVYIPSGTYNLGGSVTVRANVSLIGAGRGKTVLRTSGTSQVINVLGNNTRVSGFSLISTNYDGAKGINVNNSVDFRIDNLYIEGYSYAGVAVDGRDTRGVIDHCEIKMKIVTGLGYGVMVLRDDYWQENYQLGTAQATFIEDCTIINARHAVAANQGACYVFRHNHVYNGVVGQQVDAHGIGHGSVAGTRAIEVYNNVIENPTSGTIKAVGLRGGKGVIFDNTFSGYNYGVILMVEDSQVGMSYPVPQQIHDMYIWNNDYSSRGVVVASSPYSLDLIRENRDYYLYAMPGYKPYTYPHPLTGASAPEPDNQAPEMGPISNQTVSEGQNLTFTISATDPDGDGLTYSASGMPSGCSFNAGSRTFSWTPTLSQAGTYNVTFRVTDRELSDSRTVTITVLDVAVNQAPVLNAVSNRTVTAGQALSFTVFATDPDGDSLTYSAAGLPAGSSFNASTRTFSWTPAFSQTGSYEIAFRVSDGELQDRKTMTITVQAPAASELEVPFRVNAAGNAYTDVSGNYWQADQAFDGTWGFYGTDNAVNRGDVAIGNTADDYIYQTERWNVEGYRFSLPDGQYRVVLHFAETFAAGTDRRVFDVSVQGQTVLPSLDIYAQAGMNNALVKTFDVTVSSGVLDISVSRNVALSEINGIEILPGIVNRAPELAAIPNRMVKEGQAVSLVVSAKDPDGDALVYSASGLPAGSSFNPATRTFSWTPSMSQAGTYTVVFQVSDGKLQDSQTVGIIVEDVPIVDFKPIRVNAGGGAYRDGSGNIWQRDQAFDGEWGFYGADNKVYRGYISIGNTAEDYIYRTERWNVEGYRFTVPNGEYRVVLHFAETFAPGTNRRVFDVSLQGQSALSNLDIYAETGMNNALIKALDGIQVKDGTLDINISRNVSLSEINGIEIYRVS